MPAPLGREVRILLSRREPKLTHLSSVRFSVCTLASSMPWVACTSGPASDRSELSHFCWIHCDLLALCDRVCHLLAISQPLASFGRRESRSRVWVSTEQTHQCNSDPNDQGRQPYAQLRRGDASSAVLLSCVTVASHWLHCRIAETHTPGPP